MPSEPFVTYAQNCEDVLLWRALKHVERGFYIDVGAQDPVNDSVTKAFYERGWRGINIEPVRRWFDLIASDRPHDVNLNLAVSNQPGTLKLFEVDESGLSTSDPEFARRHASAGFAVHEQEVECTTLDQICVDQAVGAVHFLKVDCEGAEQATLEGISLSSVRPWIILVEATEPNSTKPTWQDWEHLLTGRGYGFVFFDGLNRYYLAEEHQDLASAFVAPANILDGAQRIAEVRAHSRIDRLLVEVDGLKGAAENARLRSELAFVSAERDRLALERDGLVVERDGLVIERDGLVVERSELVVERDGLVAERDGLIVKRSGLVAERDELATERDGLVAERSELMTERDKLVATRDRLAVSVADLLASRSWRITAPLRKMTVPLRMLRRRLRKAPPLGDAAIEARKAKTGTGRGDNSAGESDARIMDPDQVMARVREEIVRRKGQGP